MTDKTARSTALRIPCPRVDDEDNPPLTYWWWYRLYRHTRVIRHWFGLHDWSGPGPVGERGRCTWCGTSPSAATR